MSGSIICRLRGFCDFWTNDQNREQCVKCGRIQNE